jgi:hypothetical protein
MKALISVIFILSSTLFVNSQTKTFTVSGKVIDCKDKSPIKDIPLRIVCGDGKVIDGKTDDKGNYKLIAKPTKLPVACIIYCNFRASMTDFSPWTREKKKFMLCNLDSCSLKITEDFCLVNMAEVEAKKFPDLFYDYNVVEPIKTKTDPFAEVAQIMLDNPTFVIGIDSHYYTEEARVGSSNGSSDSIQHLRSEFIKKKLVEKGIDPARLEFINHKDNSCGYIPSESAAKSVKTKKDRSLVWAKIRHIRFTVVRTDYVPPNSPKEK